MKLHDYIFIAFVGVAAMLTWAVYLPDEWSPKYTLLAALIFGSVSGGAAVWCLDRAMDWLLWRREAKKEPPTSDAEG